eukprot:15122118-Alexandrium_andersonii.AAC.1
MRPWGSHIRAGGRHLGENLGRALKTVDAVGHRTNTYPHGPRGEEASDETASTNRETSDIPEGA